MLGHQQLLQQQHQHQHQHQHLHAHQQQLQQQFAHQDYKANSGHAKQPTPHLPVSAPFTLPTCVSIKPSASIPPAYPYPSRSGTPVYTPSLPSVSPSPTTLVFVSGEGSTGTGEDFVPNIKKAKYSTSLDPRGFIPVYEYDLYGHPIMWDQENLYVHFTGIWKALGKTKADIVKIIDANPILESIIRKVRGGFLKIQGTWMPHQEAYDLAKKTCYRLRHELVPVFGPGFVNDCTPPDAPGFGSIHLTVVRRRASECVVGQRQPVLGPQQLRLHQIHVHPSLKRRYSSNDVSRIGRLGPSNGPTNSHLSSSSFLFNHGKNYQQSPGPDGDQDDDLELDMDEEDRGFNHNRIVNDKQRRRFSRSIRYASIRNDEDDEDADGSTEDEDGRQSLPGSYDGDDIDIDGESYISEQDDPMHGLAHLDLSRRNSSPMPLNTAYALSGNVSGTKSLRSRRGRPPTRSPLPMVNKIAANYVAYNNYVSSNTQAAQGLGRNSGQSARAQKQQLRQQKLQNQLQQHQQQQQSQQSHQHHQQQHYHPLQAPTQQQQVVDQDYPAFQAGNSAPSLSGLTHQELVEFFKAGQALQRMSQDDGIRPWKQDSGKMILPNKIVLGKQVFQCVGGEYKCVPESNNSSSTKPPGEDEGWSR